MERDQVAALLAGAAGYLSGQEMSRALAHPVVHPKGVSAGGASPGSVRALHLRAIEPG